MKIAFLLPSPDISGGVLVVYKHALYLKKKGHEVFILSAQKFEQNRTDWYPESKELIWQTYDEASDTLFDFAIATWWQTAYELYKVKSKKYIYFVQSIESLFYHEADVPSRSYVDATYFFDIGFITEATWIKDHLKTTFNRNAQLVRNGIDKAVFTPEGEVYSLRENGKLRVLVEGPIGDSYFLNLKNVRRTVELCRQSNADEIWLMTSSDIQSMDGVDRVFSKVPFSDTAKIYRSCDVIVKLSHIEGMFGPPLEMFHCGGTAIVYKVNGHDEYIQDDFNSIVVEKSDEQKVIDSINSLKNNPELLERLKKGAAQTAREWSDWDKSSEEFEKALFELEKSNYSDDQETLKAKSLFQLITFEGNTNIYNAYKKLRKVWFIRLGVFASKFVGLVKKSILGK